MQNTNLLQSAAAIALLAGTMTVSFAAEPVKQAAPAVAAAADAASDDMITASARTALSADAQIAGLPILVTTRQGVVLVSGDVPNAAVSERVAQILGTVSGVKIVKNELKVKAG
jgi:hyperosmotically inducible protein